MKKIMIWMTLSALAMAVHTQAGALSDKLYEAGADWLLGTWTGTTENGQSLTLTYDQLFDGQAASVHFKSGGMEMKGLIAFDRSMDEVRQFGVTNTGELVAGSWDSDGSELTLSLSWTEEDGSYKQRTYVYQWVDSKTAKVVVYQGSRWSSNATKSEITLKRKAS